MDVSDLKDMAIVSLQEGARLGRIKHALFDVATRQLGALEVSGDDGTFVVPFAQVHTIGNDAVTVTSIDVTQARSSSNALDALRRFDDLEQLNIVDEAGTFLGTISTLEIDPLTGQITRLVAHKGGVLGMGGTSTPIDAASVLTIGSEILTVTTAGSA